MFFEVDDKPWVAFKSVTEQQRQIGTWARPPRWLGWRALRQTARLPVQPLPLKTAVLL